MTYSGRGWSFVGHSSECWVHLAKHGASIHRRCSELREETWLRVQVCPECGRAAQSSSANPNQRQIMVQGLSPEGSLGHGGVSVLNVCRSGWHASCFQSSTIQIGSACLDRGRCQRPVWCISMLVLASSAVLMSCWCPLHKEEQWPCCLATGQGCWWSSCSSNHLQEKTWKHLWIKWSKMRFISIWQLICHLVSLLSFALMLDDSCMINMERSEDALFSDCALHVLVLLLHLISTKKGDRLEMTKITVKEKYLHF